MKEHENLFFAIMRKDSEDVINLLESKPELYCDGIDIFNQFIKEYHGFDVESRKEVLDAFLNNGANPNHADKKGATPMHAFFKKFLTKYNITLYLDGDIDSITREFKEVLNLLIKHGGDINIKDKHGMTPLVYAIIRDGMGDKMAIDFTKTALELGANPLIENSYGKNLFEEFNSHGYSKKWATEISAIHEKGLSISKRRDAINQVLVGCHDPESPLSRMPVELLTVISPHLKASFWYRESSTTTAEHDSTPAASPK